MSAIATETSFSTMTCNIPTRGAQAQIDRLDAIVTPILTNQKPDVICFSELVDKVGSGDCSIVAKLITICNQHQYQLSVVPNSPELPTTYNVIAFNAAKLHLVALKFFWSSDRPPLKVTQVATFVRHDPKIAQSSLKLNQAPFVDIQQGKSDILKLGDVGSILLPALWNRDRDSHLFMMPQANQSYSVFSYDPTCYYPTLLDNESNSSYVFDSSVTVCFRPVKQQQLAQHTCGLTQEVVTTPKISYDDGESILKKIDKSITLGNTSTSMAVINRHQGLGNNSNEIISRCIEAHLEAASGSHIFCVGDFNVFYEQSQTTSVVSYDESMQPKGVAVATSCFTAQDSVLSTADDGMEFLQRIHLESLERSTCNGILENFRWLKPVSS